MGRERKRRAAEMSKRGGFIGMPVEELERRTLLAGFAITPVALFGDPAPGLPAGTTLGDNWGNSSMDLAGIGDGTYVAFTARTKGGGLPADTEGLWVGEPGALTLVYKSGDLAPGGTAPFLEMPLPIVRGAGTLAYTGAMKTTPSYLYGIWAGANALQHVVSGFLAPVTSGVSGVGQVPHSGQIVGKNAIFFNNVEVAGPTKLPPGISDTKYDMNAYSMTLFPPAPVNAFGDTPVWVSFNGKTSAIPDYSAIRLLSPSGWGEEVMVFSETDYFGGSALRAKSMNDAGQVLVDAMTGTVGQGAARQALLLADHGILS